MDGSPLAERAFSRDELLRHAESAIYPAFQRDGRITREAVEFLAQLFDDAHAEELSGLNLQDFVAGAHAIWRESETLSADAQYVALREMASADGGARTRLSLEIVGPDMPFLVDSIMGEITVQGLNALALFHPIVACQRNSDGKRVQAGLETRESYIWVHLDPLDAGRRRALLEGVQATLADVRAAVTDFPAMRARMQDAIRELQSAVTPASPAEQAECVAFLTWLVEERFAFLGAREQSYPRGVDGKIIEGDPVVAPQSGLGVLRAMDRGILRRGRAPTPITAAIGEYLDEPHPIIVSKSNLKSRVHRRVYADYVGVKRYDANAQVIGETRFVGLFTAESYNSLARDIPLLRRKAARVLERAGKVPGSHSAKALRNIVENYPRDELFQISEDELLSTALGVSHLQDMPRTRIFVRRDRFDRYASILLYLPRERYNSDLREKIGAVLSKAYGGRVSAYYPSFNDGPLARVHFIVGGFYPGHSEPDVAALEERVVALSRSWEDEFEQSAREASSDGEGADVARTFKKAFTAAYREAFLPEEALRDILDLKRLSAADDVRVRAYRVDGDPAETLRCKIYSKNDQIPLSSAIPIFENLGTLRFVGDGLSDPRRRARRHRHDPGCADAHRRWRAGRLRCGGGLVRGCVHRRLERAHRE